MWGDRLAAHRLAARRHLRALEAEQRAERVVLELLQPGERELGAAHQPRVVAEHRLARGRGRGRVRVMLGWRVVAEHRLQLDVAALGISPYISPTSPHVSPHLPTSPHISPYLPHISPGQGAYRIVYAVLQTHCSAEQAREIGLEGLGLGRGS